MAKSPAIPIPGAPSRSWDDIRFSAAPRAAKKWNAMSEQQEWWEEFFPVWAEVQRQAKSEEETRVEADCIENLLQLPPRATVLDVPCGEGRLALQLAALGFRVTGVDITLPLLEDARQKAAERRLEVTWEHRDMRDLAWHGAFDGAFCFWGSFGYFDEQGNADFLKSVARALKPGARFLVETHTAETLLPRFQERSWHRVGATLMVQARRYDHVRSRINEQWTFIKGGESVERRSSIRIYTYRELCHLLEAAGFTACEGYDGASEAPFQLGARRLVLVATRR
jgi:2-polyprenyl-3-methyl-5-hydroxy-6-metoxy-1,4-benzoquinol methylase